MGYTSSHAWDDARYVGSFGNAAGILSVDKNYTASTGDTYFNTVLNEIREFDGTDWLPLTTGKNATVAQFNHMPWCYEKDGTAAAGTDTGTNVMLIDGVAFDKTNIGAQTIFLPIWELDTGLDFYGDVANGEGWEIDQGQGTEAKHIFTVGTDAFYLKVKMTVTDVTGITMLFAGFRGVEPHDATFTNYLDYAGLNVKGTGTTTRVINSYTDLNNSGTPTDTATSLSATDATEFELCIFVDSAGAVTYRNGSTADTVGTAFSFDSTDTVMPFITFTSSATDAAEVLIASYECGIWEQ